jgi:septal ring factor EnvC (AmiA/AmiB activator)
MNIIMNSMSEMHAEIEARDRARHEKELGQATLADEFNLLEQQLNTLREQTVKLKNRLAQVEKGPPSKYDGR